MIIVSIPSRLTADDWPLASLSPVVPLAIKPHNTGTSRPQQLQQLPTPLAQSSTSPFLVPRRTPCGLAHTVSQSIKTFQNEFDSLGPGMTNCNDRRYGSSGQDSGCRCCTGLTNARYTCTACGTCSGGGRGTSRVVRFRGCQGRFTS